MRGIPRHLLFGLLCVVVSICSLVFLIASNKTTVLPPVTERPQTPATTSTSSSSNDTFEGRVDADDERGVAFNTAIPSPVPQNIATVVKPKPYKPVVAQARARATQYAPEATVSISGTTYPLRTYKTSLTPTDPNASQWWLSTTKLPQAWDITTGSNDVTIAIIDTGFALNHEEFTGRWHQNPGEIGPADQESPSLLNCTSRALPLNASCNLVDDDINGIVDDESGTVPYENPSRLNCTDQAMPLAKDCNNRDDDGNSLVDDVTGWDFINHDPSVQAGQLSPNGTGTTHGTMVTGVAAATGNNGVGIAGVNWGAKILPIQALDDDSYGDTVSVGQSIYYALDQGVDIISISLGAQYNDPYVRKAIEEATEAGIIVIAASGNDGCNCVHYPARYPEVLAVGASASNGNVASFTSYGNELDIVAPGVGMRTSTWTSTNGTSAYAASVNGTSFATPYVAGLIGLMKSQQPNASPLQLIGAVTETTALHASMTTLPHSINYGFGLSDAQSAVTRMTNAINDLQVYKLNPVQAGAFLRPTQPYEASGLYTAQYCGVRRGSTPIYELTKTGSNFFTISKIEEYKARNQGYTSKLFAYACVQQNHDQYQLIRLIDIYKEFRNDYTIRNY